MGDAGQVISATELPAALTISLLTILAIALASRRRAPPIASSGPNMGVYRARPTDAVSLPLPPVPVSPELAHALEQGRAALAFYLGMFRTYLGVALLGAAVVLVVEATRYAREGDASILTLFVPLGVLGTAALQVVALAKLRALPPPLRAPGFGAALTAMCACGLVQLAVLKHGGRLAALDYPGGAYQVSHFVYGAWPLTSCLVGSSMAFVAHALGRIGERAEDGTMQRFSKAVIATTTLAGVLLCAWRAAAAQQSPRDSVAILVVALGLAAFGLAVAAVRCHVLLVSAASSALQRAGGSEVARPG